jgi:hypothetical protein
MATPGSRYRRYAVSVELTLKQMRVLRDWLLVELSIHDPRLDRETVDECYGLIVEGIERASVDAGVEL